VDDDKLVIEMGKTTLTIKHDGDLVIDSNAKVSITSKGDTSIESKGNIDLKTTSGNVTIEGMSVSMKGKSGATVDGGSSTTVKGGSISIAGTTNFSAA
jgi:hypothetical protein